MDHNNNIPPQNDERPPDQVSEPHNIEPDDVTISSMSNRSVSSKSFSRSRSSHPFSRNISEESSSSSFSRSRSGRGHDSSTDTEDDRKIFPKKTESTSSNATSTTPQDFQPNNNTSTTPLLPIDENAVQVPVPFSRSASSQDTDRTIDYEEQESLYCFYNEQLSFPHVYYNDDSSVFIRNLEVSSSQSNRIFHTSEVYVCKDDA